MWLQKQKAQGFPKDISCYQNMQIILKLFCQQNIGYIIYSYYRW